MQLTFECLTVVLEQLLSVILTRYALSALFFSSVNVSQQSVLQAALFS